MTYTLFMPADQGIRTAADGVAEVSMTEARANLTELIRGVRYGAGVAAFKERGERRAYVVTPDFYEQAQRESRFNKAFNLALASLAPEDIPRALLNAMAEHLDDRDAAAVQNIADGNVATDPD